MAGKPDKYVSCVLGDERYMFVLNHEGQWAAEDLLDKEWPEIVYEYNRGNAGTRIQVAVVFALTRKHHWRDLPDRRAILRLLDQFEEADEEEQMDFMAALQAAISGMSKTEILKILRGEDEEDEAEEAEEAADEGPEEAPKDSEPSKTTKKPTRSRSAAGKASSNKP